MSPRGLARLILLGALAGCARPAPEPTPPPVAPPEPAMQPPPPPPPDLTVAAAGWTGPTPLGAHRGDQIYDYMNGEGEIPVACGYRALHVLEYRHESGLKAKLELYDMVTAANAFGLYSQRREPGDTFAELSHRARVSDQQVIFWKGAWCLVLLAEPAEQGKQEPLLALAGELDGKFADPGALPELLRYLPTDGLRDNSAGYFHGQFALDVHWPAGGNLLNLGPRTDVVVGDYEDKALVIIVEYPVAAAADGVLKALGELWKLAPKGAGLVGANDTGSAAAMASGERLGLVLYAPDGAAAERLLERLAATLAEPGPAWTGA